MMRFPLMLLLAPAMGFAAPPDGGGSMPHHPGDEISAEQRARIDAELARNVADLQQQGKLQGVPLAAPQQTGLRFPLRPVAGFAEYGYHGISNFVDLDPAYPNRLLDWNCGTRTYDLDDGYNHAGIDFFTWPFPWLRMDQELFDIVAAAPGTIIGKSNGYDDRSCPGHYSEDWNAVYVQHADGSVAWYGHMKKDSLTTRNIGDVVAAGDFLGKVGSSGFSSAPHLHFENHSAVSGYEILEPYSGACNAGPGLWAEQPPYYESGINQLTTGFAAPDFHGANCPAPAAETPNLADHFMPGDTAYFTAYYRDQMGPQPTSFEIRRPDGSVFHAWSFRMSEATSDPYYSASYWYWSWNLPTTAPTGTWRWLAAYEGRTYEHRFTVGDGIFANGFD